MKIIGHRGAAGHEPENTLISFKKALDLGVDMIELDVHVLATGELIVMHDNKVDRTTDGTGYVRDYTFSELRKLDAGHGEKIPLLSEVLDLVDKKVPMNIELKGLGTAKSAAELIKEYKQEKGWTDDLFIVSSFNHIELAEFIQLMPSIHTGALSEGILIGYAAFAEELGSFSTNLSAEFVTPEFVDDAHKRNLEVFVYTINDESEIARMCALGVDGIFTNFPDEARLHMTSPAPSEILSSEPELLPETQLLAVS
jgi:glycerophosphoryl diester phosphodiesterase